MNLVSLLTDILGDCKQFGNGELYFHCPFCNHHKNKFAINVNKGMYKCWHCNTKGRSLLYLFKRLDVSPHQVRQLRELVSEEDLERYRVAETSEVIELRLPSEYTPLWIPNKSIAYRQAIKYLSGRGVTEDDVVRYELGYATSGRYANSIIIPSYDGENKLNLFVARAFYDTGFKYSMPPVSKNVVVFENQINWQMPVVLVEGVFDAFAVRRNAVPLLGKSLLPALRNRLVTNRVPSVYIALDRDAEQDARQIEQALTNYGISTKLVLLDKKDPSELGFGRSWELIHRSRQGTFMDFILSKL